jgi:hypothetical protein
MMGTFQLAAGASGEQAALRWAALIRAEYCEMPGLCLTKPQIQRLWGLDPGTCNTLIEMLETEKFLKRVADAYILGGRS